MNDTNPFGILTLDRGALAANYALLRQRAGPSCAVAGVVKADSYGLGMAWAAPLLREMGCRDFFVATPHEGEGLRGLMPERDIRIVVLGGASAGDESRFEAARLTPAINSLAAAKRWREAAKNPVFVHFDTAMNRLGMGADEAARFLEDGSLRAGLVIEGVMSHFASADERDDKGLTREQAGRFAALAGHFPEGIKSLANSGGLFRDKAYALDLARPGIALYGGNPGLETNPMRAVAALDIRVLQVRRVRKGESVGYGATHVFGRDAVTATLGFGYADGFARAFSGGLGRLYWQGQPCPVLGRVSMDLTSVDITDIEGPRPIEGDYLEALGPCQSVDALAALDGTISYEILTSLGRRYVRRYKA